MKWKNIDSHLSAGRAGRTGPGVCYRIYSEKTYSEFKEFSAAEIHRVPLESLLLQMISMGLPDARLFPFIEPPDGDAIENGLLSLKKHVSEKSFYSKKKEKTLKNHNNFTIARTH